MKFFIPAISDSSEAEDFYASLAARYGAAVLDVRIYKLSWRHNKQKMTCCVGEPLPAYYETGKAPVVAIFDREKLYQVCTVDQGVVTSKWVGKNINSDVEYFCSE
jgi:hypothetical protein